MNEPTIFGVKYFTAIVLDGGGFQTGKKYRNIRNVPAQLTRFENFAKEKFPGATHINYYAAPDGNRPREFLYQKKFVSLPS